MAFTQILKVVLKHVTPWKPPRAWNRLKPPSDIFHPPKDLTALRAELRARNLAEAAGALGIAVEDEAGDRLFLRATRGDLAPLAILRDSAQQPLDLLTPVGCLSAANLPLAAVLADARCTQRLPSTNHRLFVASTMEDYAVLTGLQLPATMATGLDQLGSDSVAQLTEAIELQSDISRRGMKMIEERKPRLVMVGWSPSQLHHAEPAGLAAVRAHWLNLGRYLDVGLDQVKLWSPTEEEVEKFRFRLDYGDHKELSAALLASVEESKRFIDLRTPVKKLTYSEAFEACLKDQMSGKGFTTQTAARERLRELQETELIRPLVKLSEEVKNPVVRNLLMAAADISRLHHAESAKVVIQDLNSAKGSGPTSVMPTATDQTERMLVLSDRLVKISESVHKWMPKTRKNSFPRSRPKRRGSANSD